MPTAPLNPDPQLELTEDEQRVVRTFVALVKLCNQSPELTGPVNRVLEKIGLQLVRVH
jgi:hypothetical protein